MLCGIANINTTADNGNCGSVNRQSSRESNAVNAYCHARNHSGARSGKVTGNNKSILPAVIRYRSSSDDSRIEAARIKILPNTSIVQKHRRINDISQRVGISRVSVSNDAHSLACAESKNLLRSFQILVKKSAPIRGSTVYNTTKTVLISTVYFLGIYEL